jgi:HK97 family phage prohead protease
MGAIGVHHTPTSTGGWDGPANEARLKLDQDAAYYKKAYAWQDPDGDPALKGTYKFIHHEVSGDGTPGAANLRGCSTGIGVLNGGRGGTTIPDTDRPGVWRHLAAHLRDGDMEPPELKALMLDYEYRAFPLTEVRVQDGDDKPKITGHAAIFNVLSEEMNPFFGGGFREKVAPGAFTKTLKEADIRALWNHNPEYVLGRNVVGTLTLAEDERGLAVTILPPETTWARDLMISMKRGDVDQMSFGFRVIKDKWERYTDEEAKERLDIRTLLEVRLFDVSVVTFPAYPQTDAAVRAAMLDILRSYLPPGPGQEPHPGGLRQREPGQAAPSLRMLRKRLELAERE